MCGEKLMKHLPRLYCFYIVPATEDILFLKEIVQVNDYYYHSICAKCSFIK